MRKLLTAIATVMLLLAGSLMWKAEAAMTTGVGGLAPLTKSYTPVETIGYYYRRGYYGYRRPYYGYGYRPYYRRWRY
jgi:hypothetical protein